MKWFRRNKKKPGWVALSTVGGTLRYVHGLRGPDGTAHVLATGTVALADGGDAALTQACSDLSLDQCRCALLLEPDAYQMLQVDAPPNVSGDELKSAVRWRIKDMIDWPADQATVDVLPIPRPPNSGGEQLFVVAARNEFIANAMRRFDQAGVPLEVIDVAETAQRNLSALFEEEGRATALLHLDEQGGLLTVTSGGELYMVRRIDVSHRLIRERPEDARGDLFDRVLVEVQRTLDSVDRQYSFLSVSRVVVGPEPVETGVTEFLRNNLSTPVISGQLPDVMEFADAAVETSAQSALFPLFGCVLRGGAVP